MSQQKHLRRPANRCYLCGGTQDLTRDHIPPANVFLEPRPSNLITVPSARNCNQSYSLDDEAMRAWLSAAANRSATGERIWRERVVGGTFQHSPALRASFAQSQSGFSRSEPGSNSLPLRSLSQTSVLIVTWSGLLRVF
jgi:hypothetical protein